MVLTETQKMAVQGLLTFLPALQNKERDFIRNGYWSEMASIVSTATAQNLFRYLHDNGFILPDFDWMAWSEEALSYLDNRSTLKSADWQTLYQLLTAHIRADRTSEGHYDAILENGFLRDILMRMQELSGISHW